MNKLTAYTLGFAFDTKSQNVVLIEKTRPKWQAGKLNGVGGHFEESDDHIASAMAREFYEETGVLTRPDAWQAFAVLHGPDWFVRVFRTFTDDIWQATTRSDEGAIRILPLEKAHVWLDQAIPNLRYLVPLGLDKEQLGVAHFHYGERTK